jgi:predicted nucleic acid-binding protein
MVYMEVLLGAENKAAQNRADAFLGRFLRIYLTIEDQIWAEEQLRNFRLSYNVGILDCLIAAPSHRLQLPLYTRNLKHFTPLLGTLAVQAY